ncbi:hypothetical protein ACOQFV_18430 [Nocardiopsis changdeensis]|uniref:Uncharacterized protein n=1 Tax=Nocardiopsis changdeensis TaxID=2831969 RepID=A0ABX8BPF5_9ACTN|nr:MULTISPECIES: hypothetical protein [Nocardiopsis]QUX24124.1 hypothetical protein KGD84_07380 [Nocardiopsis changdeensis]QYX34519.1 hypothetical protein K1J57_16840 [Nocardiopsis sp. MT53]
MNFIPVPPVSIPRGHQQATKKHKDNRQHEISQHLTLPTYQRHQENRGNKSFTRGPENRLPFSKEGRNFGEIQTTHTSISTDLQTGTSFKRTGGRVRRLSDQAREEDLADQPVIAVEPGGQTQSGRGTGLRRSRDVGRIGQTVLSEIHDEWQVSDRCYFSEASMIELLGEDAHYPSSQQGPNEIKSGSGAATS